jgi:hypothetical protein
VGWLEKARAAGRAHKYSFLISVLVTALGLGLYIHSYVAESQSPLALFVRSIEAKTYDMRFRVRGRTDPAPEIVIVAIDQATLERLGSWPFPRIHYARMLDRLTADGAAVVGFDINFPRPDTKSGLQAVQQARQAYLEATPSGDTVGPPGYRLHGRTRPDGATGGRRRTTGPSHSPGRQRGAGLLLLSQP